MIELNRIYNENCLEGMKRIPAGSVDVIATDPPYAMTATDKTGLAKMAITLRRPSDVHM